MIKTLIKSTRMTWASKNANMFLLALTYAYFSNTPIDNPLQILGGLVLVSVLWGALYTLNDLTDLDVDRRDRQKQNRAFIENLVEKEFILLFVGILTSAVFIVSFLAFPPAFTVIMFLMLINQLIYTLPPIRLKETGLAPFFSTATNSVLRLATGAVLLGNVFLVPLSVYLFMYLAGMGTYLMYKSHSKDASLVAIMGGGVLIYMLYSGDMNLIQFVVAILPSFLAAVPLYLSLFTNKDTMFHLADILYHQVAMVFFIICIIVIIF
ncbi:MULTISPECIES: UbiA family prenyltransferase [Methanobacterium]|uniref:UbiA family prenyltransferase n=1 Tax=Methanobacterium subterraneum TaxID=59277 RepID=A0A7K4DLQ5_9EURY|nr:MULTISPECIES: UbiA family prenyltransferase [Methanobacterium]AUB58558.1 prenyltransferase [Methanobacterium sp. MZ-A1]MBW4257102.1 UbiA family prenyltransferase [Methanobacterium sp. YSL]MCC7559303.1 UbiA family prenyltransferase [Methanobacterium sp.]NMO08976.1 UbiA family prenyltransferase [Methanobacterium subterraneum]